MPDEETELKNLEADDDFDDHHHHGDDDWNIRPVCSLGIVNYYVIYFTYEWDFAFIYCKVKTLL